MNKYDLFDAFGGIDDGLLHRAEEKSRRPIRLRPVLLAAAAAVLLLAATAVATPAVKNWLRSCDITITQDAEKVQSELYWGYIESSGRVDLNLENVTETPEEIQELRLPTWFDYEDSDWEYTPDVVFPDEVYGLYTGIWQRWFTDSGKEIPQYLVYHQSVINPAADPYPAGYGQFTIDLGNQAPVDHTTMTIGDTEYQVFQIGFSELPDLATFPAHTDVIWTDGEYAYHISAGGMDLDMIAQVIQSVEAAPDMSLYIRPAQFDLIETYYTLSEAPENLPLTDVNDRGFEIWQRWGPFQHSILLHQRLDQLPGADVDNVDLEFTLADISDQYPETVIRQEDVDGMQVSMVWTDDFARAYWNMDQCTFTLDLDDGADMTPEELADWVRRVIPTDTIELPE